MSKLLTSSSKAACCVPKWQAGSPSHMTDTLTLKEAFSHLAPTGTQRNWPATQQMSHNQRKESFVQREKKKFNRLQLFSWSTEGIGGKYHNSLENKNTEQISIYYLCSYLKFLIFYNIIKLFLNCHNNFLLATPLHFISPSKS